MDLIFLHGAPAAGKRTVGRALLPLIPARLLENHDSIDLARTVMDFGAPGFWGLVGHLRMALLRAAASSDLPCLIMTACYVHPEDLPEVEAWEALVTARGGRFFPLYLRCPEQTLFTRVGNADRASRGKLTSAAGLHDHLARNDYRAVPSPHVVSIDTGKMSADAAAHKIAGLLSHSAVGQA